MFEQGGGGSDSPPAAETRAQDSREFRAELPATLPAALAGTSIYFGIYEGLQGDAIYSVEVPDGWDGDGLVMWTHGYAGETLDLSLAMPPAAWRLAVLNAGYAWAASSYSANWYDARAGIEDTNKLAINFVDYIEQDYGERYTAPVSI
ncbi:hypothetical protein UMZ34_19375 [Halopseudomonas pachastrellae]|nr:hypothetical protein UMZ34_19375 [Halopseudomonas pachastrellae]